MRTSLVTHCSPSSASDSPIAACANRVPVAPYFSRSERSFWTTISDASVAATAREPPSVSTSAWASAVDSADSWPSTSLPDAVSTRTSASPARRWNTLRTTSTFWTRLTSMLRRCRDRRPDSISRRPSVTR